VRHHSTTVVQIELRLRAHLPSLNSTLKTRLGIEHVSVWADMGSDSRDQVVRMPQHRTPPLTHTVTALFLPAPQSRVSLSFSPVLSPSLPPFPRRKPYTIHNCINPLYFGFRNPLLCLCSLRGRPSSCQSMDKIRRSPRLSTITFCEDSQHAQYSLFVPWKGTFLGCDSVPLSAGLKSIHSPCDFTPAPEEGSGSPRSRKPKSAVTSSSSYANASGKSRSSSPSPGGGKGEL